MTLKTYFTKSWPHSQRLDMWIVWPWNLQPYSLDLRLDSRLGLDPDRVSLKTLSGSNSSRIHKANSSSRDATHDVSLKSLHCLVCVTSFNQSQWQQLWRHLESTIASSLFMGARGGPEFAMVTTRMTHRVHSTIYSSTHSQLLIYLFEKTCQHIDFVSMTVISCVCKTNTSLVVIFKRWVSVQVTI